MIAADGSLNIEDYRANERTFNMLVQVAGRAGREKDEGKVIIQTYNPDNFSIEYAKHGNYEKFYETEILLRRELNYPPFCDIILFDISSRDKTETENASSELYNILEKNVGAYGIRLNNKMQIFKPVPAPISKIKNRYRYRIIAKCKLNNNIINLINDALEDYYKLKYNNVRVIVDTNPNNLM